MQLSRLASEYLQHMATYKGCSPRTCECYGLTYAQFRGYLQGQGLTDDVRNFNAETCEGFAQYLAAHGIKANSINVKLAGLSSLAQYAMRKRHGSGYLLAENPMTRFERPQKQRPDRKFLYLEELHRLLAVEAAPNERLALALFVDTGLRVSELTRANVEDVYEDAKGRAILSVTVKGRGRAEERVQVPLGLEIGERIKDFLLARNLPQGKEPLLVSATGTRYRRNTLSEVIYRLAKRAGITRIPVRPHALRHTYNVLGRQAGLDAPTRAALLNHTDSSTVQRYDHLLPDETFEAREKVRAMLR